MNIVAQTLAAACGIFCGLLTLGLQALTTCYGVEPFLTGHAGFAFTLSGGMMMLGGGLLMPYGGTE